MSDYDSASGPVPDPKMRSMGIIALVFRCKVTGGQLATNEEAIAFQWASHSDVSSLMTEAYAIRVLDALRQDHVATVRNHDGTRLLGGPGDSV